MQIDVEKLESDSSSFSHRYGPEEFELGEQHARLLNSAEVSGRVERKDGEFRLRGRITAGSEVDCDRCLKAVSLPVDFGFDLTYIRQVDYAGLEEGELQDVDLAQSVFAGNSIDLDELVREQILLALPARVLCCEYCKGLCPECGADRNLQGCDCNN